MVLLVFLFSCFYPFSYISWFLLVFSFLFPLRFLLFHSRFPMLFFFVFLCFILSFFSFFSLYWFSSFFFVHFLYAANHFYIHVEKNLNMSLSHLQTYMILMSTFLINIVHFFNTSETCFMYMFNIWEIHDQHFLEKPLSKFFVYTL